MLTMGELSHESVSSSSSEKRNASIDRAVFRSPTVSTGDPMAAPTESLRGVRPYPTLDGACPSALALDIDGTLTMADERVVYNLVRTARSYGAHVAINTARPPLWMRPTTEHATSAASEADDSASEVSTPAVSDAGETQVDRMRRELDGLRAQVVGSASPPRPGADVGPSDGSLQRPVASRAAGRPCPRTWRR